MSISSGPGPRADSLLLVQRIEIDPAVYATDIPLVVSERCRDPGPCDDGTTPEPAKLVVLWQSLRWLIAAYPETDAFNQRQIADRAGIDQKSVHKWLRKLHDLELIARAGTRYFPRLTGAGKTGGGTAKEQPVYTIPLRRLHHLSAEMALDVRERWRVRLFGSDPSTPPPSESQLTLNLSDPPTDQALDPPTDQTDLPTDQALIRPRIRLDSPTDQALDPPKDRADPPTDQGLDPPTDRADPPTDQALDPPTDQLDLPTDQALDPPTDQLDPPTDQALIRPRIRLDPPTDQALDPPTDHMGRKEGRKEGRAQDTLTRTAEPPEPPDHEFPLDQHPLRMWHVVCPDADDLDDGSLAQLAREHDESTGGSGWYWLGRAILAVRLSGEVRDWLQAVRATLRRWRTEGSYGSDRPDSPTRPRQRRSEAAVTPPDERVSDTPILFATHISGAEKMAWQRKFRDAQTADERRAVLACFHVAHPLPTQESAA